MFKLELKKITETYQVLLVNHLAEDLSGLLMKILSLTSIIMSNLKMIICYLPKGATTVDTYFAKRI